MIQDFQNARGIIMTGLSKEVDLNLIARLEFPKLLLLNIEALNDLSNVAKLIKKTHQLKFLRIMYKIDDIGHEDIFFDSTNQLTTLLQLRELHQLTVLELQNFPMMKTFPNTTIEHMPLKTLCLQSCHDLMEISHELQNLTSLKSLFIQRCNKLTHIHTTFKNFKALKMLSFEGCEVLEKMPHGLGKLPSLEKLYFIDCKRLKIDESDLASLTSLTTLNFKGCEQLGEM